MSAVGFLIWIGVLVAVGIAGLWFGTDTRPTAAEPPESVFRRGEC